MDNQRDSGSFQLSRRGLIAAGVAAAAAGAVAGAMPARPGQPAPAAPAPRGADSRKRALRFAHPTDIHVQPELRGGEGMAACFAHMMNLSDQPELIVTGGDLPMDTGSTPEARSRVEWDLFKKVLKDNVDPKMPILHAIGNHDVFGRDKTKSKATGKEPFYGKRWFMENFGYERTWRSFDRGGWHFVILDSITLHEDQMGFTLRIIGDQLDWLKEDLARTPATTPTVVISHVPIMSVANFFDKDDDEWNKEKPLDLAATRMHNDCRDLDALFQKHKNVKLCLSGHLHLLDRCVYNGVTYICDGAVSGAKWKGPKRQTAEGYGLIDLFDDGSFEHRYVEFGWKA
ncbi:MAG: metallophosphoesterase [Phycisphaerales bacterium]